MVAGNVSRIIRAAGKLVVGPTDLTAADPYGGTEIGLTNGCLLTPLGVSRRIENEGLGEASDILQANNRWLFTCFWRGADDDAKNLLLKGNRSAGGTTQHGLVTVPGARTPGQSTIDYANVVLLFVPENLTEHDALIIYRGIPVWSDAAEVAFQKREEFGYPLSMDCLRNGSGNILQMGRLADLSLT